MRWTIPKSRLLSSPSQALKRLKRTVPTMFFGGAVI